eukprot:1685452-Prymnesium_polylepis.1
MHAVGGVTGPAGLCGRQKRSIAAGGDVSRSVGVAAGGAGAGGAEAPAMARGRLKSSMGTS